MFESLDLWEIIGSVVALVLTGGAGYLATKYSAKYNEIKALVAYAVSAASDDKITAEEVQEVIKRLKALV